ncbi:MAG: multifunctional CCA tRNA nucleotidyl transferase/2'3'-cyclic phosphodiesterase/2'nucleotidase/phosphatase [unclassified Hahellaceae]|nr:multifunctional CCA tRNA nucleotidyl transferase/2'3'-cyclic phosphodiesterase/2'nucleotidase/phosphatase [Hahellaceae bacterium]|tara:strand:- start:39153 stop:40373 length:1221 start_codon:yes stop_codon:yes gene_type:complete
MEIFLVGGAVRDELLGRPVVDRDYVVTGATPEELIEAGFTQIGNDFPTFLHPQTHEEYALARTERKAGKGHTGFICDFSPDLTLEEDLQRRDLTINAMARGPGGELIDPYGGQTDLKHRLFRHVSSAFVEDPLRVLRVARFAARFPEFSVAEETRILMTEIAASGELQLLTPERVWKEMSRALLECRPSRFFEVLMQCAAIQALFPEFNFVEMQWDRTLQALDAAATAEESLFVRMGIIACALEQEAADSLNQRLKTPKQALLTCRLCANKFSVISGLLKNEVAVEGRAEVLLELFETADAFRRPELIQDCLKACLYFLCTEAQCYEEIQDVALRNSAVNTPLIDLCTLPHQDKRPWGLSYQVVVASLAAAASVDAKELIKKGFKGIEVGRELRKARLEAVQRFLA